MDYVLSKITTSILEKVFLFLTLNPKSIEIMTRFLGRYVGILHAVMCYRKVVGQPDSYNAWSWHGHF